MYPYSSVDEPSSHVVRFEMRVLLSGGDFDIPYLGGWRPSGLVAWQVHLPNHHQTRG